MISIQPIIDRLRELHAASTQGKWISGSWRGQCRIDHRHSRATCHYEYSVDSNSKRNIVTVCSEGEHINVITTTTEYGAMADRDSEFIAAAHNHLPEVLAELERLRKENQNVLTDAERRCIDSWKRDELIWLEQEKELKQRLEKQERALAVMRAALSTYALGEKGKLAKELLAEANQILEDGK